MDYKEKWQEFFEEGKEAGVEDPGEYADRALQDWNAELIDAAYERHWDRLIDWRMLGEIEYISDFYAEKKKHNAPRQQTS